jgi:lipoyl(octanoyl) transferase
MISTVPDAMTTILDVRDLGRMRYADALAVQRQTHDAVLAGAFPGAGTMLLVEHEPVITVSQRKTATANLLADASTLQRLGIEVQPTDRGGDITYHGPGQLVAYPIIRLTDYRLNLGRYMRLLEEVVIDTVATWGVQAGRIDGCTGVWVGQAKLCALGVRVRRNVTLHGLALNVTTDLSHFQTIIPCGITGKGVTSLAALLGDRCPPMSDVKTTLIDVLRHHLAPRQ